MLINRYTRYNTYRIQPIHKSEETTDRHGSERRKSPKKEITPFNKHASLKEKIQPSMVGILLDRWA
jgi:hypothetical protein